MAFSRMINALVTWRPVCGQVETIAPNLMLKWLLFLLLLWVGISLWNKGRVHSADATRRPAPAPDERMVACANCGVHLPESEALRGDGGASFCCDEHLRLGPRLPY